MKSDQPRLSRRGLLQTTAGYMAIGVGSGLLQACASRPSVPPEPPKPPKPITLLAVLPVASPSTPESVGFGAAGAPIVVPVHTGHRGRVSAGGAIASIGVGLIVASVIAANREDAYKEKLALADALSAVKFDPAAYLDQRLAQALEQRGVQLVRITDVQLAADLRGKQFAGLPAGVDAVLDVALWKSGYFASSRAGGFSPMLEFTAALRAPVAGVEDLDEFGYYSDWREGGGDRRWLTAPKSLTYPSVERIKADAAGVRAGLEGVVDRILVMLADDVQRHARGQLRLE